MRKRKIFISLFSFFVLSLFSVEPSVFASEISDSGDLIIEKIGRDTFIGNGGSVTLTYMSTDKSVAWKIKPYSNASYTFTGSMEIRLASNNSLKTRVPVLTSGTGSESGYVPLYYYGLRVGTMYKAVFNGVLKNSVGTTMLVDDGVEITFAY